MPTVFSFRFFFFSLSLSLFPNILKRNIARSCLAYERNGPLCEKRVGSGADDTEGSMIVRENVYERGKRKESKTTHGALCELHTETLRSYETIAERSIQYLLRYSVSIDRKEFFDIKDREIQSCARTKRK